MAAQLDRLAQASELANVALRILPFAAGFHPGMVSGAFVILRFPPNGTGLESEPPTVYSDLLTGTIYLDKPHEIARYDRAFGEIWAACHDEDASINLLRQAADNMRGGGNGDDTAMRADGHDGSRRRLAPAGPTACNFVS
jgi:hypothetical protein